MGKIERASTHQFEAEENILPDANVLLIVSDMTKASDRKRQYEKAFEKIKKSNCRLIVDFAIVSEFINRYSRTKAQEFRTYNQGFKRFRKSKDFKPIAKKVSDEVKQILKIAEIVGPRFDSQNADRILDEFAEGDSDFNDQVILETCQENDAALLTDDADFARKDVLILTENQRLLK